MANENDVKIIEAQFEQIHRSMTNRKGRLRTCHGSMSHEVLFQAGIILFPVELLVEMGDPPCVISTRDSLLFRMRFSRLFFVFLIMAAWEHTDKFCW